mmetsp:Transcript_36561/g.96329  ORF Transcript_36561/g.96329 Transcript_36561/m.96329 type:complete len:132 (-) Transcript_36561:1320-1715(-)
MPTLYGNPIRYDTSTRRSHDDLSQQPPPNKSRLEQAAASKQILTVRTRTEIFCAKATFCDEVRQQKGLVSTKRFVDKKFGVAMNSHAALQSDIQATKPSTSFSQTTNPTHSKSIDCPFTIIRDHLSGFSYL